MFKVEITYDADVLSTFVIGFEVKRSKAWIRFGIEEDYR